MMQLFVSDKGFVKVYGMRSQSQFIDAVKLFCKEVGAPRAVIVDSHRSEKSREVRKFLTSAGTTLRVLEGSSQHQDRAELYIGLMKRSVGRHAREQLVNVPVVLRLREGCGHHDFNCK